MALLRIKEISLVQFKNYEQAAFRFHQRIVGICGNNGVGKTNLLDALYYLCFTKSYFSRSDQSNVLKGAAGFRIAGEFDNEGRTTPVTCILRANGKKEFLADGLPYGCLAHHRLKCVEEQRYQYERDLEDHTTDAV